jgi:hypothetical protein
MLLTPPALGVTVAVSNSGSADRAENRRRFCRSLRGVRRLRLAEHQSQALNSRARILWRAMNDAEEKSNQHNQRQVSA